MNNTFIQSSYKNKIARISLKIVIVFTVLVLMMLTTASIYVHYNKEKIIAKIKEQVYNNVRGEVHIKNIDIAVWSSFPYIAAQLNNVSLLDSHFHTPLLNAAEISCKINLLQLLGKVHDIAKVRIANGSFHLFTDSLSYSNAYLLRKKDTASSASSSSSSITIHNINLENVSALIENVPKQKRYEFHFSSLKAHIDKTDSILEIELDENCFVKGLGFYLAKGIYLQNHTVNTANCSLKFNTATRELTFDKTSFDINHHIYFVQGKFHFRDSSFFQLHIQTKDIQYKQAMKVLTERIQNKLAMVALKEPF